MWSSGHLTFLLTASGQLQKKCANEQSPRLQVLNLMLQKLLWNAPVTASAKQAYCGLAVSLSLSFLSFVELMVLRAHCLALPLPMASGDAESQRLRAHPAPPAYPGGVGSAKIERPQTPPDAFSGQV